MLEIAPGAMERLRGMCAENGCQPIYATIFGSFLYGTAIPGKSDLDVKGLFLPDLASLALVEGPRHLRFSTGSDDGHNSAMDVDIELWSLQYWLLHLLPAGDTGALDLLFSPSNSQCVLFCDPRLADIFANPWRFINISGSGGYATYCTKQAKKYGIKGSRVGVLKKIQAWLRDNRKGSFPGRLGEYLPELLEGCEDRRYCFLIADHNGEAALQVLGRLYMASLPMEQFASRIENLFNQYGSRAVLAEQNQGLDFKALSHAVRALEQMLELLDTGSVKYPLKCAPLLVDIKQGKYSWLELEPMILEKLELVNDLSIKAKTQPYDMGFARRMILSCYGLAPGAGA